MLNGYIENKQNLKIFQKKTQRNNINELLHLFGVHFSCKVFYNKCRFVHEHANI